ncbi:TerD-family protein [Streptomyces ruber]|uniref:TerD-family protein n=2 Tax=Streptomyces TaxID=1883 RepID=A0A918B917_9ACTN|nr:TerD family protein [Streptomyces ruber]GGQ43811.1 TerD-family protein [Streptomyces ruber]
MKGLNKGIRKVEVSVKWDPSPLGQPSVDLDLLAATYLASAPHGDPDYVVSFDSRSPDGTITLGRDSKTGQGFGWDEVMVLELDRLAPRYARVVVGVAIQQQNGKKTFADIQHPALRIREGYDVMDEHDFGDARGATAATVAEFVRDDAGVWSFRPDLQGYDADPASFARIMGAPRQP